MTVNNSHVIIQTERIDRVVAFGPMALGHLIREMSRPDVPLDTFTRCYTACDQIVRKAGVKQGIRWHGGLIETEEKTHRVIGTSRIDGFSATFRKTQLEEIVRGAKKLRIVLGDGR